MIIDPWTAFLDANALYSQNLRSLFMHLALRGLFRPKWSRDVQSEVVEAILRNRRDLDRSKLERCIRLMDENAEDALVEGYEHFIPSIELPDPNDRHVVAAAVMARAQVIVTNNLKDFPQEYLWKKFGLRIELPDVFLVHLTDLYHADVLAAVKATRAPLKHPPISPEEFIASMERNELPTFARLLNTARDLI